MWPRPAGGRLRAGRTSWRSRKLQGVVLREGLRRAAGNIFCAGIIAHPRLQSFEGHNLAPASMNFLVCSDMIRMVMVLMTNFTGWAVTDLISSINRL